MSEIAKSGTRRNAKLASLPLGMAGRAAAGLGKRLAGRDKDEVNAELTARAAEQIFAVLGELKGGAMKLGQALSVMEAAVPEEFAEPYRDALVKLQAEAPPLPAEKVHRVLDRQLGTSWRTRFAEFDDVPAASASIGQVHRGIWADGRPVAVKVQYPGADVALRSDLRTLSRLSGLFKALSPGSDVKAVINELIERTEAELDYRAEADNQRAFAVAFADDPDFVVPRVIASAPKVIVSEWLDGVPLSDLIKSGTAAERDEAARKLTEFEFSSASRVGLVHGDPHPGNFRILADGRMAILDFGAVGHYPDGLPSELGHILRHARDGEYEELCDVMRTNGFILPGQDVSPEQIKAYLRPYVDPLYTDEFRFSRRWLQRAAGAATNVRGETYQVARQLNLPPQYVMILRVLLGCVGICAQLDATAPYRRIAAQWVPGFEFDD